MDRYDVVIIGMGSAGLTGAGFAAALGLRVCAVDSGRIGGDCLWTGCVPSKALLAAAKAAHAMRTADRLGLPAAEPDIDTASVLERVRAVQRRIAAEDDNAERYEALGVDVLRGHARLVGPREVAVEGRGVLRARGILICTGSRPAVPDIAGLADAGFLTSETVWELARLPASLCIVGGGPVGVELAQACARLGGATTLLEGDRRILPRDEPELSDALAAVLRREGIVVESGTRVDRVELRDGAKVVHSGNRSWTAQEILVATGRRPQIDGLGLQGLGIAVGARGIEVDDAYRTAVRSVYAVGDVVGRHHFTHSAGFEAARALRNMLFPGIAKGPYVVPWCTFTDPELAHVGLTVAQARERHGDDVTVLRKPMADNDRARADGLDDGALLLVAVKGRLVGAHALTTAAGELIGELAVAVQDRRRLTDLAQVVHVYPTRSLAVQQLAGEAALRSARRLRLLARRPW